jgi:membrane protease YdiL (CAAX protease family)
MCHPKIKLFKILRLFVLASLLADPAFAALIPSYDRVPFPSDRITPVTAEAFAVPGLSSGVIARRLHLGQRIAATWISQGFPSAALPEQSSGPGSAGKNLETVLPRMLLERRPAEAVLGEELLAVLKALPHTLSPALSNTFHPIASSEHAAKILGANFEAWLRNAEHKLKIHVGPVISRAVREQLRRTSELSTRRRNLITGDAAVWCQMHQLNAHQYSIDTLYKTEFTLNLKRGPKVHFEVEAVNHKSSFQDKDHFVDAINMSLGPDANGDFRFAVFLQDRACKTAFGTGRTLEHEIWEVGLRALGYPPDQAHAWAIKYVNQGKNVKDLMEHPRHPEPTYTSGPSASESEEPMALRVFAFGLLGALTLVGLSMGYGLIESLFHFHSSQTGLLPVSISKFSAAIVFIYLLGQGALAGLVEEILFRYYILKQLSRKIEFIKSNVIQALLFTLSHYLNRWLPIPSTSNSWSMAPIFFLGGLLFGFIYRKADVEGSSVAHVTRNIISTIAIFSPKIALLAAAALAPVDAVLFIILRKARRSSRSTSPARSSILRNQMEQAS